MSARIVIGLIGMSVLLPFALIGLFATVGIKALWNWSTQESKSR